MGISLVSVVIIIYYFFVFIAFFYILLENKNPLKTQSYLLIIVLIPIIGMLIYLFFGMNYRKTKLFSRKVLADQKIIRLFATKYEEILNRNQKKIREHLNEKWRLPFLAWRNARSPVTINNKVTILQNGEAKFPVLLEKINAAKKSIYLEYYIVEESRIWREISDLLLKKATQGIEIKIIIDGFGNNLKKKGINQLKKSGIQVYEYNPVRIQLFANRVNYRNHRKIVIIDNEIAFTGGINISDYYINNSLTKRYWRDTHCMIEGEACSILKILFSLNWYFVSGKLLEINDLKIPAQKHFGDTPSLIIGSDPDSDSAYIMETYFQLINSARKEIIIITPYFIPNDSILDALKTSAKSGVKVKLMVPLESDTKFVTEASYTFYGELIENDVEVYIYTRGMIHSKVIVVDREISTIGTANMDYRSFDSNAEVIAMFFDAEIANQLVSDFTDDCKNAIKLSYDEWEVRPLVSKLIGAFARLMAPLL